MSLPSGPIQSLPNGLLGLLQLKNMGNLPDVLLGNVQPIIDMVPFWLRGQTITDPVVHGLGLPTGTTGLQSFSPNPILVPEGQMWWVRRYTVQAVVPVGATERIDNLTPTLTVQRVGVVLWQALTERPVSVLGNAASTVAAAVGCGDFWASPGSEIGFYVGDVTTGSNVVVNGQVWYTPVPI